MQSEIPVKQLAQMDVIIPLVLEMILSMEVLVANSVSQLLLFEVV